MLEGVTPFPEEYASRYRALEYWQDRTLAEEYEIITARYSDRIALHDGDSTITYRQLADRSTQLARSLVDLGVQPLDRLVVQLTNNEFFAYLYLALHKVGAIPILALPSHRYHEINQFVSIGGAIGAVVPSRHGDHDYVAMLRRIADEQPNLRLVIVQGRPLDELDDDVIALEQLVEREPSAPEESLKGKSVDPTDPAVFLLSGGTTGIPKLIPRTHNDYAYNSKMAVSVCDVSEDDVLLIVLPIEHNFPLACPGMQGFLSRGASVVFSTSSHPGDVFDLIERHGVTHIHLVPSLLIRWLNDPGIRHRDLSSVRVIQSGGQRLQPEVRRRAERLLPDCTVQENFGMAEGLLMFVRLDDPEDVRLDTCGRPVCPDDEIMLVDENGELVEPGEVGELVVRGPYTIRGYFRAEEHNARAFSADGFYRSGDLMRQHPTGNYIVEGRRKDLINRGGEKISAEEVENLILAHPAVANVACVPLPDEALGERMCACVVLQPDQSLTLDELVSFLLTLEIAKHKLPERLELMESLPLSAVGKVSKKNLVRRLAG
jgi:2,3-dihydroxybenzoate-AMP ligase